MLGSELKKLCDEYPDFDFQFGFIEDLKAGYIFPNNRTFEKLELADVGYSDKVVVLSGEEVE